jgi:hypothetical protein
MDPGFKTIYAAPDLDDPQSLVGIEFSIGDLESFLLGSVVTRRRRP